MTAITLASCDLQTPTPTSTETPLPSRAGAPPPRSVARTPDRIRVLVVDADPLARRAIADLLRDAGRFVVVATAADGHEGVALARHHRPDVALIAAASPPALDAVGLVRRVVAETPRVRAVVLTVGEDDELAIAALRAGASGIVPKEQAHEGALAGALAVVNAGEVSIPGELARLLVERIRRLPEPGRGVRPIRSPLTTREWEVLDLLVGGLSTRAIAERLVLTEDTVYSHVKNLTRKLGVHSREQAVRAARALLEDAVAA